MNRLRNLFAGLCPALLLAAGLARAETPVWSDGFETNAASRWSLTGVWKVGSPTAGPAVNTAGYRTHSGTNCLSTLGYPYSQDARIVCTNYNGASSLLVPSTNQFPRLRFWHWFNFNNALGYVEISTNAGTNWIQLSPTYLNLNGGGVWSRPSFDLSGYAGLNVQIAFHFTSGCCVGNGLGWFVDDVEVDTDTPILDVPESFESGEGDWSVDYGTWEVGKPTSGPGAAHTGANCAATVLAGNYANNVDTRLLTPPFTVPTNSPALRFWQWYNFENALGFVEINNGTVASTTITTTTITTNVTASLNTNIYQLSGAAAFGYSTPFYWNPTIGGWTNGVAKVLGNVYDLTYAGYRFEAGNAPFVSVGQANVDYLAVTNIPVPQSAAPTNFLTWQGMTWNSATPGFDNPVGYFGTNYSYSYTTNTTTTTAGSAWQSFSQTTIKSVGTAAVNSGGWTNAAVDLSAYAGQVVQIAFHFTSGGLYSAAGWYVDDVSVAAAPALNVPADQTIYFGQTLTNTLSATNSLDTGSIFTFGLASASSNVVVNTNGVLTWTNTAAPPGTYVIDVKVTDDQLPPFSVTNNFSVTVLPLPPPVLTVSNQTVAIGQTLAVTMSATNAYLPNSTFTFSLPSPSTNAWMDTNKGVLTWTNTTAPSGTYSIAVKVADNSNPPLVATNSFTVTVTPPPTLIVPGTQTIHAGQTLTATIFATNPFLPGSAFTFSLPSPSTNYWITTSGVLTWTNTGIHNGILTWTNNSVSPGTNHIYVAVTDNSSPAMSATSNFDLIFLPPLPPTLSVPDTRTIYAGQTLVVTNLATNTNLPGALYTYALLAGPAGMDVSDLTTNGVLKWATATTQAAGSYTNIISALDNSVPPLAATNSFVVVVSNPPPPVLTVPPTQAIYVGQTLAVTNYATNSVFPNATFTFSLAYGPANVMVSPSGTLTWTPTAAQAPSMNYLYVKVTDNNSPPLSAIDGFLVLVSPTPSPILEAISNQRISAASGFHFTLDTQPNITWRIDASTNLLTWLPVYTNAADASGALQFTDLLATNFLHRYYRAVFP